MSRFNSFGTFVSGNGGPISYDGILAGGNIGTCAQWLSDHVIIANVQIDGRFVVGFYDVWNTGAGWQVLDPLGCNALEAGGGRWAAFTNGRGVFGDVVDARAGLSLQNNDQRGSAGPDGTLATVADYQSGLGLRLDSIDVAPGQICRDVQVLNRDTAVWNGGSFGIELGAMLPGQRVRIAGGWVSYYNDFWGVVAHPLGHPELGRVIGQVAFHHDMVAVDGNIRVGYSTGVQERPDEWRVVDVLTLPLVDLTNTGVLDPIVEIGRPMWLGLFTGSPDAPPGWPTDIDPHTMPGNAYLRVADSTFRDMATDTVIAKFIAGTAGAETVEEIEQAAWAVQPLPALCFWDAREWPREPNLPPNAWKCQQAYCGVSEPLPSFEADVAMRLERNLRERPQQRIAIVPQCYTNRNDLTKNIGGLVPIFSRLGHRFQNVYAMAPFSGTGRKTGLWEHPEVRPLWDELAAGIPGTPTEDPVSAPNVFPIVQQLAARHPELVQPYGHYPTPEDASRARGEFTQRLFSELPDQEWGCVGKTSGEALYVPPGFQPRDVNGHHIVGIAESVIFHRATNWQVQITASGGGAAWMEIPQELYRSQNPWLPEEPWEVDPDPDPKPVSVLIHGYDPLVHRSDPRGMLVRFEAESARPITKIEIDLENDDEPGVPMTFGTAPGTDGRYVRALAFKPVRNGTWPLRVTATNDQGQTGQSDGSHRVTVVE